MNFCMASMTLTLEISCEYSKPSATSRNVVKVMGRFTYACAVTSKLIYIVYVPRTSIIHNLFSFTKKNSKIRYDLEPYKHYVHICYARLHVLLKLGLECRSILVP